MGLFCVLGAGFIGMLILTAEPVKRLKADPPPQFLSVQTHMKIDKSAFAKAYWSCARNLPYSYSTPLPTDPPPGFRIPEEQHIPNGAASEIRKAYWTQLQKDWLDSHVWESTYTFRWLSVGANMIGQLVGAATGR
jgi:hypothetical protein